MVQDADLKPGQPRLLTVNQASRGAGGQERPAAGEGHDVIHGWAMPPFGIKLDAVPGRLQMTWFRAERDRRLLWPVLGAVRPQPRLHADHRPWRSEAEFNDWVKKSKQAACRPMPLKVASAEE